MLGVPSLAYECQSADGRDSGHMPSSNWLTISTAEYDITAWFLNKLAWYHRDCILYIVVAGARVAPFCFKYENIDDSHPSEPYAIFGQTLFTIGNRMISNNNNILCIN